MDVLKRITELRKNRGWTEYKLAEESNLSQSTISSWYRKNMTPSVPSLEKICSGFDITLSQFFALESESVPLTTEQREILNKWSALPKKQKEALLQFLDYDF